MNEETKWIKTIARMDKELEEAKEKSPGYQKYLKWKEEKAKTQGNMGQEDVQVYLTAKDFLNELSAKVMDRDYPVSVFVMNANTWNQMTTHTTEPNSDGEVGTIWGISIQIKNNIPDSTVYCLSAPEYSGIRLSRAKISENVSSKEIKLEDVLLFVNLDCIAKGTYPNPE